MKSQGLLRVLSLGALITYGVGDILGAGIYAIVGKIAGHAGPLTWFSFSIAMGIVFLTALCYSELGSRFPKSGGVSIYIQEGFGHKWLSVLAGLLLFSATILSMSTLSQAFIGYVRTLGFYFPNWLGVFSFFLILLLINLRGIKQSSIVNIVSTAIEVSGLLIVMVCGFMFLSKATHHIRPQEAMPGIVDIFQGTALAFFAFTGFEDLANVAEEVKEPEQNLPRAILSALGIAGFLYLAVSWIATSIISGHELSQSEAPLLAVVQKSYPAIPTYLFSSIAIFAVANTCLLNYITASRLLYGMSKMNLLPRFLQHIHGKYQTPYMAIFVIFPLVLALGLVGTLQELASATSAIVLTIFSFSCIALIKIKLKGDRPNSNSKIFQIPMFVPWLAILLNIAAISFLPIRNIIPAVIFIVVGLVLSWLWMKR